MFEHKLWIFKTTINISRGENNSEIKIASKQGHPIFKGSESATWVCVSVPWGPFLHCTDAITLPILLENFDIYLMYTYTAHPPKLMIKIYVLLIIFGNIAIVNPQQNHRGTLSIPSCSVPDTHLISDDSQVQSRYLHIWRGQFYNFNLFGLWKVDNWTSEKRTLFLYDNFIQRWNLSIPSVPAGV